MHRPILQIDEEGTQQQTHMRGLPATYAVNSAIVSQQLGAEPA